MLLGSEKLQDSAAQSLECLCALTYYLEMNRYACKADEPHMAWTYEWRRRLCIAISTAAEWDISELWAEYGYTFRCREGDPICRSPRLHAGCEATLAVQWILFYAASMGARTFRKFEGLLDNYPNLTVALDGALAGRRLGLARALATRADSPSELTVAFAARRGSIARRVAHRLAPFAHEWGDGFIIPSSPAASDARRFFACCRHDPRKNPFLARTQRGFSGHVLLVMRIGRLLAAGALRHTQPSAHAENASQLASMSNIALLVVDL